MVVWEERGEGGITKGHKESFGADKYTNCLDRSDRCIHMSKLMEMHTLNICNCHVSVIPY